MILARTVIEAITTNQEIIDFFVTISPIIAFSQIFDFVQTVEVGVLRSMGYQNVFWVSVFFMFAISAPLSYWLAFDKDYGFFGVFSGLLVGIILSAIYYSMLIWYYSDWKELTHFVAKKNESSKVDLEYYKAVNI